MLRRGEKRVIDRLGDGFVTAPRDSLVGTEIWEHAGKIAKQTYFKKGLGFPHLSTDDVEIRLYPGLDKIAFAWGYRAPNGKVYVAANVYGFGAGVRVQLEERGLLPRMQ
jgi:hypothetical protein